MSIIGEIIITTVIITVIALPFIISFLNDPFLERTDFTIHEDIPKPEFIKRTFYTGVGGEKKDVMFCNFK